MMRTDMKKQMSGAPKKSMRPKMRPEGMDGARSGAPKKSMRPKMRPEMIGNTPGSQGTRGIDPMENYGAEGMPKMKKGGGVKKMMGGGMAKSGYKAGGKVRGYGKARGGKACKMR